MQYNYNYMMLKFHKAIFKKKLTTDNCSLCNTKKEKEEGKRICSYCTQVLTYRDGVFVKNLHDWAHFFEHSPRWLLDFLEKRFTKPFTVPEAREHSKLSQEQLAVLLGVSVRTIQRWELAKKLADENVLSACSIKS